MNLKSFTILSGLAVALIAVPVASAQRPNSGSGRGANIGSQMRQSSSARSSMQFSGRRSEGRSFQRGNRGGNWSRGDRGRNRGDGQRWAGNRGRGHRWHGRHRHHHRHFFPGFYYSGFGYPYGFGYGYGYPYYGASASLYYNGYYANDTVYQPSSGGSVVAQVQEELAQAGYYRGAVDGVIGPRTRSAIRAYERANGLRVDGRIDSDLLSAMGIG